MAEPVLVSACLLGLATRYDGSDNRCDALLDYLRHQRLVAIPVCPEQLAGLPTPRPRTFFTCGDGHAVLDGTGGMCDELGNDMTSTFFKGAAQTLKVARLNNCRRAILKQRSPSCGCGTVYRHSAKVDGDGVTTALLLRHNIDVVTEEKFLPESGGS